MQDLIRSKVHEQRQEKAHRHTNGKIQTLGQKHVAHKGNKRKKASNRHSNKRQRQTEAIH